MTDHPDLLALLRGELSNAEALATGEHLEGCEECREELADAAVAHALLASAARVLPGEPVVPLRPLRATAPPSRRGRWYRRGAAAVAAVVAAVVGFGLGAVLGPERDADDRAAPDPPPAALRLDLEPLDASEPGAGIAEMLERDGRTEVTVRTRDLPGLAAREFYFAWLLDPQTARLLPLGRVRADGTSFDLDDAAVTAYSVVDISLEADDGHAGHSGTSVLRGSYEPEQIPTTGREQG